MIEAVELVSSSKGRFEVDLDGERIFSKAALRRHAQRGEIVALVRERIGAEVLERKSVGA